MSNKPLKLQQKGRQLASPEGHAPSRAGPARRPGRFKALRVILTKVGLGLCLAALSAAYVVELNDPATAVVARKRELPVYSVERADKVLSISFDAS